MGELKIKKRNHGIDLLRIFSMFMVLILHILGQGGILNILPSLSYNYEVAWAMEIACICAVNCYALVSGYVGVSAKYKYSNIVLLWLRVVFYTLLITLVYSFLTPEAVGVSEWGRALFPVMKNQYWYFTAYFCLFFLIPVINKAMSIFNEKQSKITVISLIFVFSVLQTVFSEVFGTLSGYSVLWLLVLYIIGAHIKRFDSLRKIKKIYATTGYLAMVFITWLLKYLVEAGIITFISDSNMLFTYTSPTVLFASIFLLALFMKIKTNKVSEKIISVFSPLAFSVYLIHTNPLIWVNFINNRFSLYATMPVGIMILYVLGTALVIYIVCSMVDFFREGLFKILKIKEYVLKAEDKLIGNIWTENLYENNINHKENEKQKGVIL